MSRYFGPPTQNGVVVRSLDAALSYWTESVGAGPFFVIEKLDHRSFRIGETLAPAPEMRIALGNWGDLQIELIEPAGDSHATWHEFLRQRRGGLHHTSVWTRSYDAMIADAVRRGMAFEAQGELSSGVRYAYFQSEAPDQPLVEVSELTPDVEAFYAFIRQAAVDWDGADPVRKVG